MEPKIKECEECKNCNKDWTKCGACPVTIQWIKEQREKNENYKRRFYA